MKITKLILACAVLLSSVQAHTAPLVEVKTPLYLATVDVATGQLVDVSLNNYSDDTKEGKRYSVLSQAGVQVVSRYFTQTPEFNQTFTHFERHTEGKKTTVLLTNSPYTPTIKRKFVFNESNYDIQLTETLVNTTKQPIKLAYHVSLSTPSKPKDSPMISSYKGFMYVDQASKAHKSREKAILSSPIFRLDDPRMLAYSDRFFSTAIAMPGKDHHLQSIERGERLEMVLSSNMQTIEHAKTFTTSTNIYAGPISPKYIKSVEGIPSLDAVLDYGFLTTISNLFYNLLSFIGQFVPNHGFAIILLTVVFRLSLYPLTLKVEKNNLAIKQLQPEIDEIKLHHTQQQSAILIKELLKEHKTNPLLSLFIPVLQVPIFLSMLWMLVSNSELRDAPWILWITDLSSPDPMKVLPFVFGLLVYIQSKLSESYRTEKQRNQEESEDYFEFAIKLLPFAMFFVFTFLPAGIVLYAITNSLFTMSAKYMSMRNKAALQYQWA